MLGFDHDEAHEVCAALPTVRFVTFDGDEEKLFADAARTGVTPGMLRRRGNRFDFYGG